MVRLDFPGSFSTLARAAVPGTLGWNNKETRRCPTGTSDKLPVAVA